MSQNRIVNALVESLENAPGKHREPIEVGRLLVVCQGTVDREPCPHWKSGCQVHELEPWIQIMLTPGARCAVRESS